MSGAGTTVAELLRVLVHKQTRLPAEIGTFLVLEACERLLEASPIAVSLDTLWVAEDGHVSLLPAPGTDEASSALALHRGLASLLVASGPMLSLSPAIMRLIEEGPRGGHWSLRQLRDDLEATLVPLNRNASRRVLARFVRETRQGTASQAPTSRGPGFSDLDSELSALLSGDVAVSHKPSVSARERDATVREPVEVVGTDRGEVQFFDSDLGEAQASGARGNLPAPAPRMTPISAVPPPSKARREPPTTRALHQNTLPPASKSKGLGLSALFVVLAVGLCAVTFVLKPQAFNRLLGRESATEVQAPKAEPEAPVLPRAGDLRVRVTPERAQVLRFIGRGPVTLPHVPQGVVQEFVATKDDAVPTRVVLPADAEWEQQGPSEPATHELAMQLRPKQPSDVPLDLGDSLLPQELGEPRGATGSLRIVTTPKGAKVYQLVGFAPEARIENVALSDAQELLIFRKGYVPQIKVVAPSDFVPDERGRPTADISVKLIPIAKSGR